MKNPPDIEIAKEIADQIFYDEINNISVYMCVQEYLKQNYFTICILNKK